MRSLGWMAQGARGHLLPGIAPAADQGIELNARFLQDPQPCAGSGGEHGGLTRQPQPGCIGGRDVNPIAAAELIPRQVIAGQGAQPFPTTVMLRSPSASM